MTVVVRSSARQALPVLQVHAERRSTRCNYSSACREAGRQVRIVEHPPDASTSRLSRWRVWSAEVEAQTKPEGAANDPMTTELDVAETLRRQAGGLHQGIGGTKNRYPPLGVLKFVFRPGALVTAR